MQFVLYLIFIRKNTFLKKRAWKNCAKVIKIHETFQNSKPINKDVKRRTKQKFMFGVCTKIG